MIKRKVAWHSFEDEVHDAVKEAVASGLLPFAVNTTKVRRKPEYDALIQLRTMN
jgi:hypothetical protein